MMGPPDDGPGAKRAWSTRSQVNRVLVAVSLCILLPWVALVERLRSGRGGPTARRAVETVARLCGVSFEMRSRSAEAPGPALYTPNHSSPIDIAAILMALPEARFLAAADLFRIPLLAGAMRALGTVPINRRDSAAARRQMDALTQRFQTGTVSIW